MGVSNKDLEKLKNRSDFDSVIKELKIALFSQNNNAAAAEKIKEWLFSLAVNMVRWHPSDRCSIEDVMSRLNYINS